MLRVEENTELKYNNKWNKCVKMCLPKNKCTNSLEVSAQQYVDPNLYLLPFILMFSFLS